MKGGPMNVLKLVLDFILSKRGAVLAAWLSLCIGTILVYRLFDVRLTRDEIGGMAIVYGAAVAAGSVTIAKIKRRWKSTL
jgi:hypothetical protein